MEQMVVSKYGSFGSAYGRRPPPTKQQLQAKADFAAHADRVLKIAEKMSEMSKARGGKPLKAPCTVCRNGMIWFRQQGPRAMLMYCDGPGCNVRIMA